MNFAIRTILLLSCLFLTQRSFAQSDNIKTFQEEVKKSMLAAGYSLVDEGGGTIGEDLYLITDKQKLLKGENYVFLGFIDNCSDCNWYMKLKKGSELVASLPNLKTEVKRSPEFKISMFSNQTTITQNGEGYFVLTNDKLDKRYAYSMLFKKSPAPKKKNEDQNNMTVLDYVGGTYAGYEKGEGLELNEKVKFEININKDTRLVTVRKNTNGNWTTAVKTKLGKVEVHAQSLTNIYEFPCLKKGLTHPLRIVIFKTDLPFYKGLITIVTPNGKAIWAKRIGGNPKFRE